MIKMVGDEYEKARPGTVVKSAHVGMAASNTYVFMTEVLPRAIKKYGGIDADALRKAALEVDLPEGGTMLGFGVKFEGEGAPMAGPERPRLPGHPAVRRRQAVHRLAQEPAAAGAGAAAAVLVAVRGERESGSRVSGERASLGVPC